MNPSITESDILDALQEFRGRPSQRPKGVFTTKEAAKAKGVSVSTVQRWLKGLEAEGRLEVCSFRAPRVNGAPYPITAYRIKKK